VTKVPPPRPPRGSAGHKRGRQIEGCTENCILHAPFDFTSTFVLYLRDPGPSSGVWIDRLSLPRWDFPAWGVASPPPRARPGAQGPGCRAGAARHAHAEAAAAERAGRNAEQPVRGCWRCSRVCQITMQPCCKTRSPATRTIPMLGGRRPKRPTRRQQNGPTPPPLHGGLSTARPRPRPRPRPQQRRPARSRRRCAEAPRARLPPGVSSLPETRWLLGAAAAAQRVASGSARPAAPVALGRGRRQRVEQAQVRVAYIAKTVYGGSDRGSAVRRRAKLHWTVLN
jgi:hypothetical protein